MATDLLDALTGLVHHVTNGGALAMHSIFYIIGVIVVVLAILSFLGIS